MVHVHALFWCGYASPILLILFRTTLLVSVRAQEPVYVRERVRDMDCVKITKIVTH